MMISGGGGSGSACQPVTAANWRSAQRSQYGRPSRAIPLPARSQAVQRPRSAISDRVRRARTAPRGYQITAGLRPAWRPGHAESRGMAPIRQRRLFRAPVCELPHLSPVGSLRAQDPSDLEALDRARPPHANPGGIGLLQTGASIRVTFTRVLDDEFRANFRATMNRVGGHAAPVRIRAIPSVASATSQHGIAVKRIDTEPQPVSAIELF
jgi:hypothetical protein